LLTGYQKEKPQRVLGPWTYSKAAWGAAIAPGPGWLLGEVSRAVIHGA
jgi:hypothetical protein